MKIKLLIALFVIVLFSSIVKAEEGVISKSRGKEKIKAISQKWQGEKQESVA